MDRLFIIGHMLLIQYTKMLKTSKRIYKIKKEVEIAIAFLP